MSESFQHNHRVAAAIYMVSSFFVDQEPLKWKLRSLSTDLSGETIKDKDSIAREILLLISLARSANLISDTNYEILRTELVKIQDEAKKPLELMFSEDKTEKMSDIPPVLKQLLPQSVIRDRVISTPDKPTIEKSALVKDFGAVSVKKNSRQSTIINLLKRKKEIMIKDVSPLISGCSEKTIQRELSQMVSAGVLRKIGEKRWTRYTLA